VQARRVQFAAPGQVELVSVPVPAPGPGQVLIRNDVTVVSPGTERAVLLGLPNALRPFPYVPGYSSAGTVLAVGPGVEGLDTGQAVVSDAPHESHSLRPARSVVPLPAELPPHRAAFAYLVTIALQGVRKARIELGESVLVLGLGLIGQLAAQLARCAGAGRVLAVDRHAVRVEAARRCGIGAEVLPEDAAAALPALRARARRGGYDVVIEATGFADAPELAFAAAAPLGRVVLLGSTRGLSTVNLYEHVHRRGLVVLGAHNMARPAQDSYPGFWTQRRDLECAVDLLAEGRLDVEPLISHRVRPEEAPGLYRRLAEWDPALLAAVFDWSDGSA
jgi:2-desacetyl-2-hydroxyethyl bacteriochlorophyllide A dehydrogenase